MFTKSQNCCIFREPCTRSNLKIDNRKQDGRHFGDGKGIQRRKRGREERKGKGKGLRFVAIGANSPQGMCSVGIANVY